MNSIYLSIFAWFFAYVITCYLMFPFLITLLKFLLQKVDKLEPGLEIGLDQLLLQWKLAPILFPYMIFVLLKKAIEDIAKK